MNFNCFHIQNDRVALFYDQCCRYVFYEFGPKHRPKVYGMYSFCFNLGDVSIKWLFPICFIK